MYLAAAVVNYTSSLLLWVSRPRCSSHSHPYESKPVAKVKGSLETLNVAHLVQAYTHSCVARKSFFVGHPRRERGSRLHEGTLKR